MKNWENESRSKREDKEEKEVIVLEISMEWKRHVMRDISESVGDEGETILHSTRAQQIVFGEFVIEWYFWMKSRKEDNNHRTWMK